MNKPPIHRALLPDGHLPQDTLLRYVRGELSPQEARQVELHELECTQCAERLEGLQQAEAESPGSFEPDVSLLRERLRRRVGKERDRRIVVPLWPTMGRVAAGLALLIVAGIAWRNWQPSGQQAEEIALLEAPHQELASDSLLAYQSAPQAAEPAEAESKPERLANENPAARERSRQAVAPPELLADRPASVAAEPPVGSKEQAEEVLADDLPAAVANAPVPTTTAAPATTTAPTPNKQTADLAVADEEAAMAEKRKRAAREEPAAKKAAPTAGAEPSGPSGYQAAAPEGGLNAFQQYIEGNIRQPADAANVKGTVVVEGVIGSDGKLDKLRIIKSLQPSCDQEALRLLREGPRWQPAKRDGKNLPDPVRVRIRFGK